ncbi:MAG: hypothetical protein ACP5KD_08245 [Fervidobacterium sp.]
MAEFERNEKCVMCGKNAQISQTVYIDGAVKKVSYCKKCFAEMIKYESENYVKTGVRVLANHMKLVQETPAKDGNFEYSFDEIYSVSPSSMLVNIFRQNPDTYKAIATDIKKRRLALLNHRLKMALKMENYKQAKKIKQVIDEINKSLKQQPW